MSSLHRVPDPSDNSSATLTLLLSCYDTPSGAGRARGALNHRLTEQDDYVVDNVICRVSAKGGVRVHDPRRDLAGALTATFTWAVFGVITGSGLWGTVGSALSGAVFGALYSYFHEHALTTAQLTRLGSQLPPSSSALLSFVKSSAPERALAAATAGSNVPALTSAAVVGRELDISILGTQAAATTTNADALLTMILVHFAEANTAQEVAAALRNGAAIDSQPQVELIVKEDQRGRLHVIDPTNGIRAMARSDVISWGGFGLVFGALVGAIGGGGIFGLLHGAAASGLVEGLFGLFAGVLYGLFAGRAISGRRLGAIRTLLPAGGSSLLAWSVQAPGSEGIEGFTRPNSRSLLLRFERASRGAVLAS